MRARIQTDRSLRIPCDDWVAGMEGIEPCCAVYKPVSGSARMKVMEIRQSQSEISGPQWCR
jgi:hypothetical protein